MILRQPNGWQRQQSGLMVPAGPYKSTQSDIIAHSVGLIPTNFLLNGIDQPPTARYTGAHAVQGSWPAWGFGNQLLEQWNVARPFRGVGSPGDDPTVDDAVRYANYDLDGLGSYIIHYHAEDGLLIQPGGDDIIIHMGFHYNPEWAGHPAANPKVQTLFSTYFLDWGIWSRGMYGNIVDGAVHFDFYGPGDPIPTANLSYPISGGYHDLTLFLRRAENSARFLFAVDNGVVHDSAGYVDLGVIPAWVPFTLGRWSNGFTSFFSNIEVLFFTFYRRPNWMAAGDGQYTECIDAVAARYAVGPLSSTETRPKPLTTLDKLGLGNPALIGQNLETSPTLLASDWNGTSIKWWTRQGDQLRIFGSGNAPTKVATPWGAGSGIQFNGGGGAVENGKGFGAFLNRLVGDVGMEDVAVEWIEAILDPSSPEIATPWSKRQLEGKRGCQCYHPVTWLPLQAVCASINHGGNGGGFDLECYAPELMAGAPGLLDARFNYYFWAMDRDRWPQGQPIGSAIFKNMNRGTAENKAPWPDTAASMAPLTIGQWQNRTGPLYGVIVAVRIWKGLNLLPADDAAIDALRQARFDAIHSGLTFGVGSIPSSASINGLAGTLMSDYTGDQASPAGWSPGGAGPTLELTGGGADPTYQGWVPGTTPKDKLVKYNGGKFHRDLSNVLDVGTEDLLWVALVQAQSNGAGHNLVAGKVDAVAPIGYHLICNTNVIYNFYGWGAGNYIQHEINVGWAPGSYHFLAGYLDHDDPTHGSYIWVDNQRYGPLNKNNLSPISCPAEPFYMGYTPWTGTVSTAGSAIWRMWKRNNWFAGGAGGLAQVEAFVQQCYNSLRPS